ncbi:MAG: lysophospholipid acyltransferase family protein [Planctomycetota bacterium]
MHRVVIEEPYKFVPPHRGRLLSWAFRFVLQPYLRRTHGIVSCSFEGVERLRDSIRQKKGVILCPNHCRDSDPMLLGMLCRETPTHVYSMASWHIFKQSRLDAFLVQQFGGFSVYREGLDRQALDTAVDIVTTGERPLVIFPEGVISRANDRLNPLMDGVSFIARVAAKRRAEQHPDRPVVIHPVALRYLLTGDLMECIGTTLRRLEERTFWKSMDHLPIIERIRKLACALLSAREIEILGDCRSGPLRHRIRLLINNMLHPCEKEWLGMPKTGDVVSRVKDLRSAILPTLLKEQLSPEEYRRRWRQLTDCYYAQTLSMYPDNYLTEDVRGTVTPERIAETVHRLEEDLTDQVNPLPMWHVKFRIGEPLLVDPGRKPRGPDPLMQTLRARMLELLGVEDWWPPQLVEPFPENPE